MYDMAKRYIRIESQIKKIPEVEDFVLNTRERRHLGTLMIHLSKLQSVTKSLQKKGLSTLTVRDVFDAMIEDGEYPHMKHYLATDADIVTILTKRHLSMTDSERAATSNLLVNTTSAPESEIQNESDVGYFEKMQQRKRRRLSDEQERYIDCSFCVATSNTVERLFSACKHILTDERLIFLKVNRELWDLAMVANAIKNNEPRGMERDLDMFYGN